MQLVLSNKVKDYVCTADCAACWPIRRKRPSCLLCSFIAWKCSPLLTASRACPVA